LELGLTPSHGLAEVHRFEQAGHYVLEDESEALTTLIEGFLQ